MLSNRNTPSFSFDSTEISFPFKTQLLRGKIFVARCGGSLRRLIRSVAICCCVLVKTIQHSKITFRINFDIIVCRLLTSVSLYRPLRLPAWNSVCIPHSHALPLILTVNTTMYQYNTTRCKYTGTDCGQVSRESRVDESGWDVDRLSIIQGVVVAAVVVPSHWAVRVVSNDQLSVNGT